MKKKMSYEKVVDAEVIEKNSAGNKGSKKLSFRDKLNKAGTRFQAGVSKVQQMKENHDANQMKKLQYQSKKTKLQAEIAKNKANIEKNTLKGKKKNDPLDFSGGFI